MESSKSINLLLGPRNSFGIGFVSAHLMINLEFLGIDLCMLFVSIFLQENKIMLRVFLPFAFEKNGTAHQLVVLQYQF